MKNSSSLIQTKWLDIKASDDADDGDDDLKSVGPNCCCARGGGGRVGKVGAQKNEWLSTGAMCNMSPTATAAATATLPSGPSHNRRQQHLQARDERARGKAVECSRGADALMSTVQAGHSGAILVEKSFKCFLA